MHREAKNRRDTLCISRFFNEAGRKICRQDVRGDLFSASLSYTRQLHDFNLWAQANGYNFILEVRGGAVLSEPLQEAIDAGEIILKTIGQ